MGLALIPCIQTGLARPKDVHSGDISAGHAIGGAMGAYLGGYLFDATGNYSLLWTGSLWLAVSAGVMVLFLGRHGAQDAQA